jgi:hypothetical protein
MVLLTLLPFDMLLVAAALTAYVCRPRIGGQLARGLNIVLIGILVLAFSSIAETLLFTLFDLGLVTHQIAHRLLVALAYLLIILGFVRMRRAFETWA